MSMRFHVLMFLVLVSPGCNLILPSLPEDAVSGVDIGDDDDALEDTTRGTDSLWGPDRNVRPDSPPSPDLSSDGGGSDLQWPDGGGDVAAPPVWECQTPMELLSPSVETSSFTRFAQLAEGNFIYVWYSLCDEEEPVSGPERGWFLQVDQVASMSLQVACEGPCWAYLMKDGCNYQNIQTCWNPHETSTLSWDVLPGTWYVAVEQMEQAGIPAPPGWVGPPFDIHAALNRTHQHPGCVPDGVLPLSEILEEGTCEVHEGIGWRVWSRLGSLPAPGDGKDRAWLPCAAGAADVDPIGGMPETILRLEADIPGDARRVDLIATLDPGVPSGVPSWAGILGLAGPPCGETASLVDCDGGQKKELRVLGVTLLPGQEAFLYLDGVGSEALEGPKDRPYRIDVRLEDQGCLFPSS
ncbi:MAG: hypothetical protein ABIK09_16680 [Pseudomonadota bacterium]